MRKMTRSISMLAAALLLGVPVRSPMHVRSARPATHPMRPIESGATAGATRGRRETHGGRNSMASFARIDPTPTSLKSQPAPAYRIRNKSTRQRFLGLIVALSAALLVGGAIPAATAAHGALGGQTSCVLPRSTGRQAPTGLSRRSPHRDDGRQDLARGRSPICAMVSERLEIHVARVLSPCATGRLPFAFYELGSLAARAFLHRLHLVPLLP